MIIPEEADVVKRIFNEYLQGRSLNDITEDLERMDAPKPHSDRNWTYQAIRYIISNEKYIGDRALERTYVEFAGLLMEKLQESDRYFYNIRSIREKIFGYYNVGTDLCNGNYCGNTILCAAHAQ